MYVTVELGKIKPLALNLKLLSSLKTRNRVRLDLSFSPKKEMRILGIKKFPARSLKSKSKTVVFFSYFWIYYKLLTDIAILNQLPSRGAITATLRLMFMNLLLFLNRQDKYIYY